MKGKKFLSWALTAALCLSASPTPAMAAAFPDVVGHWAVSYVDDTVAKNIFVGIDGKFVPDRTITPSEVLATTARISVDAQVRKDIGEDRKADIKAIMGTNWVSSGKWEGEQYWFGDEYATCLEAGIITYPELKELYQSKALTNPITKENFAFYLTRAMQMEAMALNLPTYTLNFTDKKDITPGREPYIYVLNMCGIITGTDLGAFQPKKTVTRAEAAAMLSRATDFMEENGTNVELAKYAKYEGWVAGTIVSAAEGSNGAILLTLSSQLSGIKTISIPAGTTIYENSMLSQSSQLKAGTYARVNLGVGEKVIDVRLSGTTKTTTGSVVGVSSSAVMLEGVSKTLEYDRFTEVQVGSVVGDYTLIDLDGSYTTATCQVDQLGNVVSLQLNGGTRKEEGMISSVEKLSSGGVVLTVLAFDGQVRRYTIPASAKVTSNGGFTMTPGALNANYVGSYAQLNVSTENASEVSALAMDTITQYIQGAVKNVSVDNGTKTITITELATNKATTYKVADDAVFAYQGNGIGYDNVKTEWFVTARVTGKTSGSELTGLWGYPGSSITEGAISGIVYPSGTTNMVINLTKSDGSMISFALDMAGTLPAIQRDGKSSSVDKLRTGDLIKVTVRYNSVTLIEATPQSANVVGTITEITQTTSGVTIKVELDGGVSTGTFTVGRDVSVTQDGNTISLYDLRIGHHVAMVTGGDQVSSIQVEKTSNTSGQISGAVIVTNTTDRTILFRVTELGMAEKIVTVIVPSGTAIQDITGNSSANISLSQLKSNDVLDIYGSYVNDQFKATLIIRK